MRCLLSLLICAIQFLLSPKCFTRQTSTRLWETSSFDFGTVYFGIIPSSGRESRSQDHILRIEDPGGSLVPSRIRDNHDRAFERLQDCMERRPCLAKNVWVCHLASSQTRLASRDGKGSVLSSEEMMFVESFHPYLLKMAGWWTSSNRHRFLFAAQGRASQNASSLIYFVENLCCSKCFCFIQKQSTEALCEVLYSNLPVDEQKFHPSIRWKAEGAAGWETFSVLPDQWGKAQVPELIQQVVDVD